MAIEVNTLVSVGEPYGRKLGNLTLEDAKFFGRPNFAGEEDRFKDSRRKFTVCIPNDVADELRAIGWNVKTEIPTAEEEAQGREMISHLKVMLTFKFNPDYPGDVNYETGPDVFVIQGEKHEKLNSRTVAILDRSRFENLDMEIRAWEYDPEDQPGKYSARLVMLVATLRPNRLEQKYGILR